MSAFEFTFGLISLLLGLGFAHLANSFAKLVMAGNRVRWDWLSPLAAVLAFEAGLIYWWYQWSLKDEDVTLAGLAVRAVACLTLYVVAVAAMPAPGDDELDLRESFENVRRLFFGAFGFFVLLVGVLPPFVQRVVFAEGVWTIPWQNLSSIALCVSCLFIGKRWFHGLVLIWFLAAPALEWLPLAISG